MSPGDLDTILLKFNSMNHAPKGHSYLVYREEVSKSNQGGLGSRKKVSTEIRQYANSNNPTMCFVRTSVFLIILQMHSTFSKTQGRCMVL